MKPLILRCVIASWLALAAIAANAGGKVDVSFVQAKDFSDVQSTWMQEQTLLDGLARHLEMLGEKYLPQAQVLHIAITDVDLAGSIEHTRRFPEVRVLRDITSPSIKLRWSLESAGTASTTTEVSLRDAAYLYHINAYQEGDPLRYEKYMLDDWFRRTFAAPK